MTPLYRPARRRGRDGRLAGASGFTTVELMVACVVALIVVMGISMLPGSVLRYFREGTERLRLQQNVHRDAQTIGIQVRKAASFRIYDPAHPATPLAAGPAVALLNNAGAQIGGFRPSADGKSLVNDAGQKLDDMTLTDLWFTAGADSELVLRLALRDRLSNETSLLTGITPRN
jgi:Tfp pilus assembly protein PilW